MLTPALNILGFPAGTAVGTALAQMTGSSFVGAMKHWRMNNLRPKLAVAVVTPLVVGVLAGKSLMTYLTSMGLGDDTLRYLHLSLATILAISILKEVLSNTSDEDSSLQMINLPEIGPVLKLPEDLRIPYYAITLVAFTAGLASAMMGIGGGLILIPTMIYVFGLTTITAVATNLSCIFIGASVGAISYGIEGQVDVMAALLIMAGSMTGSYIGAALSGGIADRKLRLYFALLLVTSASSIIAKQFGYELAAKIIIFAGAGLLWSSLIIPAALKHKKAT